MTQPNPNQWSNGYSGHAPQQYPPEQLAPQEEKRKGGGWLIALIVLLLAAIIGGVAYAFSSGVFEKDGVAEPTISSTQQTAGRAATGPAPSSQSAGAEPGATTAAAASEASDGELKRSYANYAPDTDVTSPEFAANVFKAFSQAYDDTGRTDITVSATSPVTGKTYSMSCSGDSTVYCRGGNNASVKIWE